MIGPPLPLRRLGAPRREGERVGVCLVTDWRAGRWQRWRWNVWLYTLPADDVGSDVVTIDCPILAGRTTTHPVSRVVRQMSWADRNTSIQGHGNLLRKPEQFDQIDPIIERVRATPEVE